MSYTNSTKSLFIGNLQWYKIYAYKTIFDKFSII